MIEGYTDADYLRLLAHWFDQLPTHHPDAVVSSVEVANELRRIADECEDNERWRYNLKRRNQ